MEFMEFFCFAVRGKVEKEKAELQMILCSKEECCTQEM